MDFSQFDRGVFLLNVLGIVYNPKTKKILIGKRENDSHVKNLSWTFPGGRPEYKEDLEYYLKKEIKKKTGLEVDAKKIVFVRTASEKREFLFIYYLCKPLGGKEKAGEKFTEIKWVKPSDVRKYFTTTVDPKLMEFLEKLK